MKLFRTVLIMSNNNKIVNYSELKEKKLKIKLTRDNEMPSSYNRPRRSNTISVSSDKACRLYTIIFSFIFTDLTFFLIKTKKI